jgi:hypothetical protein
MAEGTPFYVFCTLDGSPTLTPFEGLSELGEDTFGEKMHHPKGARTETFYIYGSTIDEAGRHFGKDSPHGPLRGCVVGAGLAYIEFVWAIHGVRAGDDTWTMQSFESEDVLRNALISWAAKGPPEIPHLTLPQPGAAPIPFNDKVENLLTEICRQMCEGKAPFEKVWLAMHRAYTEGRWQILGALDEDLNGVETANVSFFDAYSKRMSPELWSESFLAKFIQRVTRLDSTSFFASYACNGILRRALQHAGYSFSKQEGWGGKRHNTQAVRVLEANAALL